MEEVLVIETSNKNIINKVLKNVLFQVIIMLLIIAVIGEPICRIIKFICESIELNGIPEYTSTISINDDGTFSTAVSAQELWDNMKEQGYDLEKYLDSPEELETLVNATSAMQLPDTSSNIDDLISSNNNNNGNNKANALDANESTSSSGSGAMDLAKLALEYACTAAGCKFNGINSRLSRYGARFDGQRITFGSDRHGTRIEIAETKKMLSIYDEMVKGFPYLNGWYAACSPYVAAMVYYLGIDTNIKKESSNIRAAAAQDKYFAKSSSFDQIPLDPNKTFAQQCQPGDILTIDYGQNHGHTMIYVGNKLAQEYFPGTTGGMVEAGQTNGYYPGVTTKDKSKSKDARSTWHCYRPKGGSNYSNNSNNGNSTLQGVIRFKRHDKDGNESYLTYARPDEFQKQVEAYNKAESSEEREYAKNFVMTHFTLKERPKASRSTATGRGTFTTYNLTEEQVYNLARICAREQGGDNLNGGAAEASLMANLFEKNGSDYGTGADGLYNYVTQGFWFRREGHDVFENCPDTVSNEFLNVVKAVLLQGYRTLPKYVTEHDDLGDIGSVTNNGVEIDKYNHSQYIQNVSQVHQSTGAFGSDAGTWIYYCWPSEADGTDPFGYYEEDRQRINDDNCYSLEDITGGKTTAGTGTSGSSKSSRSSGYTGQLDKSAAGEGYPEGTYTSSAGLTYKAYKQGSPAPWAGTSYGDGSHTVGSYGCGVTSIAIILSGLGYDLTPLDVGNGMNYTTNTDYLNNMGVKAQYVSGNISASEVENLLSQGKVIAMHYMGGTFFGGSAPFHYVAIVDADGQGNFMVLNPGGGESGWYSSDKIAENYERVEIDVGSSTRNVSDTSTSSSEGIGYEAVVGTYTEVDKELSCDGPDVEGAAADFGISLDTTPEYTISTTNVNYEALVQPYTLQFDFLWTLLVTGQSKGFVMDLAKLAYDSDIEVSIYDNLTTTIDTDNCTYKQVTDGRFSGYVSYSGKYSQTKPIDKHEHRYKNGDPLEEPLDGYINKTVTTRTNTIEYALSKADTWIADYEMSYKHNPPDSNTQTGGRDVKNRTLQPWTVVDYSDGADPCGYIDGIVNEIVSEVNAELQKEYEEKKTAYDSANKSTDNTVGDLGNSPQLEPIDSSDVEKDITMETKIRRVEMHDSTIDTTITQNYTAETPSAIIKDDEKTKPNFVTLFNEYKYRDNRNNILSAVEWIFEIMEENEDLANILDIFKYLLYKSTGVSYGVTELDETLFFPPDLIEMDSQIEGGTIEEKVWWAVIDAGYSKEAAAGVMGNIYAESEFNASLIEAGNGIGAGLCQWSYERRTSLEKYAKSKGKKWSDEDTQIEFLIAEITPGGGANGYASYQLTTYNGYGPSDWKKASTPEDAAVAFCWSFERPGIPRMDIRKSKAKEYYNKYKNSSKSTAGSGAKYANASNSEKLKFLFPNGAPTSAKQMEQYLTTISVPITQKNGVKTTTSVVLHKAIAKDVYNACAAAQAEGFKVYEIGGYREFGTDSAGAISGLTTQSQHCYGLAVDINVNENAMYDYGSPSVGSFYNPSGSEYSVKKNGAFMKTLKSAGWGWGGDWPGNRQDYMHFSYMGY